MPDQLPGPWAWKLPFPVNPQVFTGCMVSRVPLPMQQSKAEEAAVGNAVPGARQASTEHNASEHPTGHPSEHREGRQMPQALRLEVEHWLDWQSRMISGVVSGGVFLIDPDKQRQSLSEVLWPLNDGNAPATVHVNSAQLARIAQQVIDSRGKVVEMADEQNIEESDFIGCAVSSGPLITGAVVFELSHRNEGQIAAVLQLVQWCVIWLESQLNSQIGSRADTHQLTQSAVGILCEEGPLPVVGHALCTSLAEHFRCSMVLLGLTSRLQVQVAALSHQIRFDRRSNAVSQLELAMEECSDQQKRLVVPADTAYEEGLLFAHSRAIRQSDYAQIVSVPIIGRRGSYGVLMFCRQEKDKAFDQTAMMQIDALAESIAPVLNLKCAAESSVFSRIKTASVRHYERLIGSGELRYKATFASLLLVLVLLGTVQTRQLVPASVVIEGEVQQAIVAHTDSFIQTVAARAGDRVSEGQLLATLNANELMLEREKWQSELAQREADQKQAWAKKDPAQVTIAASRIEQAKAQIAQIDTRVAQSSMLAPFDGYLISGDLSQSIGTPVSRGQLLFEIIPNTAYKLVLDVEEQHIARVQAGQSGTLRLTGLPGQRIRFTVTDVLPVATSKEGKNVFRVEAQVDETLADLRPGLRGIAKLETGRGSLLSVWLRPIAQKLRTLIWYYSL